MALATSISGSGVLVNKDSNIRKWSTAQVEGSTGDGYRWNYTETITEEVREWPGVTQTAAEGAVDAADQTGLGPEEVASYSAVEHVRSAGAYKLIKTITSKTLEVEATAISTGA